MYWKKLFASAFLFIASGTLVGCCLFSGNPTASISGPPTATVGTPVTFTATATGGTAPYTYMWSVGGAGPSITYTFSAAGSYTVAVTVVDSCGKQAQTSHPIIVSGEQSGALTGNWTGTLTTNAGMTYTVSLSLNQAGTQVLGTFYYLDWSMPGTGSYIGGTLVFMFQWFNTGATATFTGGLQGIYLVGDIIVGTNRVATVRLQR
ncbi:MAG: PKD domain-containing protein [Candidatus Bipolaricaulota bacterium]|nr:PKD domain-containing protein [Candidatus Bipolaricaulota bacterium]MDW8126859.1 PKD domain-containing protein [Candidatus Bipolaricaulota bacterium]